MTPSNPRDRTSPPPKSDPVPLERLRRLFADGGEVAKRVDTGERSWFVPSNYEAVLESLVELHPRGGRFLELGSGLGVVAIMADMLGFEAYGIEILPELVDEARQLAERHESSAKFAHGSFLPADYRWVSETGDTRLGSVVVGESAYPALGRDLADFDVLFAYPWPGQTEILRDLVERAGAPHARLLLHGVFAEREDRAHP